MLRILPVAGFPLMRSWFVAHRRNMPLLPAHARLQSFLLAEGRGIIEQLEHGYQAVGARAAGVRRVPRRTGAARNRSGKHRPAP
jgi:hypothetical protein